MKALAPYILLLSLIAVTAGCSKISSLLGTSSDPAGAQTASDVYFDLLSDVPIPRDMSVDRKRTLVSTSQNGVHVGLLTVSGRVEVRSLNETMIHNMVRQGWSLRAATTGERTMQIYEKGLQYAVIYTYEELINTVMEIWGAQRINDGAYPATGSGGSSFQLEPVPLSPSTTLTK